MTWRRVRAALAVAIALVLTACFTSRPREPRNPPVPPPPVVPPPGVFAPESVPDAVPRVEPRSRYGNPPFYDVFGQRYYVLSSSTDYIERGVASWYGPGFHKIRTSTGEPYDMYAMTAAHKTLPLPAYVRVTNLQNGRSVVVRVNDRGPFVGHRIIDLSYTAAAKLDMLRDGTAMVEVRSIDPAASPVTPGAGTLLATTKVAAPAAPVTAPPVTTAPATAAAVTTAPVIAAPVIATPATVPAGVATASLTAPAPVTAASPVPVTAPVPVPASTLFIQAGAFADPANAARLAEKLKHGDYGQVFVREDVIAGRTLYRVRIGPVPDVAEFDRIVTALEQVGVRDAHLAID